VKALVVDDSAIARKIMVGALSKAGITNVEQVEDGERALAAVMGGNFDLVLMDWHMPNMSGIDALHEIRARGKQVPIIMVTVEADKARVAEALRAGADDYLIKPVPPDLFVKRILTVLARASERD